MERQLSIFDYLEELEDAEQFREEFKENCIMQCMKRVPFEGGKTRIEKLFESDMTTSERTKAIRDEYGIGGFGEPHNGKDQLIGADYSSNGIRVEYIYKGEEYAVMIDWKHVEQYIHRLISRGDYNICRFSNHRCNKDELWKVATALDDMTCKRVCCRLCDIKMCGARCNGAV